MDDIECCANCKHCMAFPKNNKYGDIEYLCLIHGYFMFEIHKDHRKIRQYTTGERELECKYEREETTTG